MSTVQPVSYNLPPSSVTVFRLSEPMDIGLPVEQQVEIILSQAKLDMSNSVATMMEGGGLFNVAGLTPKQLITDNTEIATNISIQALQLRLREFVVSGYILEDLSTEWIKGDECRHYKGSYHGFVENGCLNQILMIHRDESARYLQEQLIADIAQSLAVDSGETFFSRLVEKLANTLAVNYAVVVESIPNNKEGMVKILASYSDDDGDFGYVDSRYSLKESPGFDVLCGESKACYSAVAETFPNDERLFGVNIDSFIGMPILGENSQQLGAVFLMHSSIMPNVELAHSILNVFSVRIASELEHRRIQEEKKEVDQQQKAFIDNNSSGMYVMDVNPPMPLMLSIQKQVQWLADYGRFVDCNIALVNMLGFDDKQSIIGSGFWDGVEYDYATNARDFIAENYKFRDHVIRMSINNKDDVWLSTNLSGVIENNKLIRIFGVMTDVTERIRHSREMEYRANHDGLTGLSNRSCFVEKLEKIIAAATVKSQHALFLLDLDGFKEVNDTLGHETGDCLLQQIGPRLTPMLMKYGATLARLGGDEFSVLIEDYQSVDSVIELASELMKKIKSPFTINELELIVGGSVGIALYPLNSDSVSSLMRCADIAMYQAKEQSKDYCLYNRDSDHYSMRRLSLMMDIRQAIDNDELRLFYQPVIDLKTKKVTGFEALVRWMHPKLGLLPPGEFIPLIELTDMIMPVTWWVVETAIKQLAEWNAGGESFKVAVNVSARNLVDVGFVSFIDNCLQRYQVDGTRLEIEITESTLMADPDKARQVLQSIAALGLPISVDDYGTGYSSLAYLKSLPITTLKIDRAFITHMLVESEDEIIVNSTVQLAHNLGLMVTAEGIEDPSLIAELDQMGCDKGQGFFFCKPIPVDELQVWLSLYNRQYSLLA